jgi:hypothetical protein
MEYHTGKPDTSHVDNRIDSPDITLDNLVGLVEKAARIVDYLQKENTVLADDVKDHQAALQSSAARIAMMGARIHALESEAEQLRRDAHWWRWFHAKYHNSTFFNYIEREYAADHPQHDAGEKGGGDALAA